MNENIEAIYEDILVSTKEDCWREELDSIQGPTLCVGAGGSKVVADYANLVLTKKNKLIAKTIDVRDLEYEDLELYKNIFGVSYSGSNFGIKKSMSKELNTYLLTGRKSQIDKEQILNYSIPNRSSFISINTTLVPMAILLQYYVGESFKETLDFIVSKLDKDIYLSGENLVNIFTGIDTSPASLFLESTMIEAGVAVPILHYKYDYCHGRSTINKSHENEAIYLAYRDTDLDRALKKSIATSMKSSIFLMPISDDAVINTFYYVWQCLYLMRNMAEKKKIDLSTVSYDKIAVKELYYFKGSM